MSTAPEHETTGPETLTATDAAATADATVSATAALSQTPETAQDAEIEKLPPKAWVTLGLFAVFVIAFGTCASNYLFN